MPNFLTTHLKSYLQVSTDNSYYLTVHFQIFLIFIYVFFFRIAVWNYMSLRGRRGYSNLALYLNCPYIALPWVHLGPLSVNGEWKESTLNSSVPLSLYGTHISIKTPFRVINTALSLSFGEGKSVAFYPHSEHPQNSNSRFPNGRYPKGMVEDHNNTVSSKVSFTYVDGVFYPHWLHSLTSLSFLNQLQSGFGPYHMPHADLSCPFQGLQEPLYCWVRLLVTSHLTQLHNIWPRW